MSHASFDIHFIRQNIAVVGYVVKNYSVRNSRMAMRYRE